MRIPTGKFSSAFQLQRFVYLECYIHDSITRLFCGNLSRKITEEELKAYLPGIVYIKWITDKETGEFYGSSFIEMKDPASAAMAVMQDKSKFMGRPLKIYYCPPRPGDQWPPKETQRGGKGGATAAAASSSSGNPPGREKTPKPEGCRKLYMGNLSYDIDDDTIVDFFKDCGTMIGLRWLTRKDTGEFRVRVLFSSFSLSFHCENETIFRDVAMWSFRARKRLTRRCCWMAESCLAGKGNRLAPLRGRL